MEDGECRSNGSRRTEEEWKMENGRILEDGEIKNKRKMENGRRMKQDDEEEEVMNVDRPPWYIR
jgi:hypothetical protein